jgi:hypothetical protein
MPEIASQQFAMLRMFFSVARRCDNTRSESSWASGPRSDTRPRWRPRVRFVGGEKTRPLFLAVQGEQPAINLLEPRVLGFGINLAKDRGVERSVGRCAAWARPQAFDLHRFDHRFAIHRFFRFGQDRNRSFDLAHLLVRWF